MTNVKAMTKGREAKAQRERRSRISDILSNAKNCTCGLRSDITDKRLRELKGGCTSPQFVCPTLDRIRRAVGQ